MPDASCRVVQQVSGAVVGLRSRWGVFERSGAASFSAMGRCAWRLRCRGWGVKAMISHKSEMPQIARNASDSRHPGWSSRCLLRPRRPPLFDYKCRGSRSWWTRLPLARRATRKVASPPLCSKSRRSIGPALTGLLRGSHLVDAFVGGRRRRGRGAVGGDGSKSLGLGDEASATVSGHRQADAGGARRE